MASGDKMAFEITVSVVTPLDLCSRKKYLHQGVICEQMEELWIQTVLISLPVLIQCGILLWSGFPHLGKIPSPEEQSAFGMFF